jgi:1-acyl-sn-glycerol-3-phosphate acyltransferase
VTITEKRKAVWTPEKKRPSFFWFLASLVLPVWGLMVGYRFTPSSALPASGPFILSPNHYSEIDPIAMGVATWKLGRQPRFMAKASLFKIPVLKWILKVSGQIPVERAGTVSPENPLGAASMLIEKGRGVIVYPEGSLTRDPDLWPMRGKSGAVRLALESGIPLYPSAHWGTQHLMPRYGKIIHPFPRKIIHVAVGEPLDLSGFRDKPIDQRTVTEATAMLMDAIAELLGELRGEKPPAQRWDPSRHEQSETGRF